MDMIYNVCWPGGLSCGLSPSCPAPTRRRGVSPPGAEDRGQGRSEDRGRPLAGTAHSNFSSLSTVQTASYLQDNPSTKHIEVVLNIQRQINIKYELTNFHSISGGQYRPVPLLSAPAWSWGREGKTNNWSQDSKIFQFSKIQKNEADKYVQHSFPFSYWYSVIATNQTSLVLYLVISFMLKYLFRRYWTKVFPWNLCVWFIFVR